VVQAGEACDDGNRADQDGCDLSCQFEVLWEKEPNNSRGTAQPVGTYQRVQGFLVAGDEDWMGLEIAQAGAYDLEISCFSDTVIELYDAQGVKIAEDDDSGYNRCSALKGQQLEAGSYTLLIRGYQPSMETEWELDIR